MGIIMEDMMAIVLWPNGWRSGVTVEFQGELVGPEDPGAVIGPQGVRYILGEAATSKKRVEKEESKPFDWQAGAFSAVLGRRKPCLEV